VNGPTGTAPAVLPATGSPDSFGRSLLLADGDLVFDGTAFAEISGLDNLTQALTLRILTPYGSDPVNTVYGLDVSQAFTQGLGLRMSWTWSSTMIPASRAARLRPPCTVTACGRSR
jgi:hypothetical protein